MVDFSKYKNLSTSRRGRILTIALDRPQVKNAIDRELHDELAEVFYDAQKDKESDVVILTGTGESFCAGGDLNWLKEQYRDSLEWDDNAQIGKQIVLSILDMRKPIICKLRGPAVGLGATIALYCDVIFASEDARIADTHVKVGLVAGDGGTIIWPMLIGPARAKELLMTGDFVSGKRAAEIGLVNHAVPNAELDKAVDDFADKLIDGARLAIELTKVSVNIPLRQAVVEGMEISIAHEARTGLTDDHAEAIEAFLGKRKPKFVGH